MVPPSQGWINGWKEGFHDPVIIPPHFERPDFFLRPVKGHSHVWGPRSLPPPNCISWVCSTFLVHLGACVLVVTSFQRKPEQLSACLPSTPRLHTSPMGRGFPRACPRTGILLFLHPYSFAVFVRTGPSSAKVTIELPNCLRCSSDVCHFWFSCCPGRLESPLGVPWRKSRRNCRTFTAFYEWKKIC